MSRFCSSAASSASMSESTSATAVCSGRLWTDRRSVVDLDSCPQTKMSSIRPPCSSTNTFALHEHSGRAVAWIVDAPLVRCEHLDQHANAASPSFVELFKHRCVSGVSVASSARHNGREAIRSGTVPPRHRPWRRSFASRRFLCRCPNRAAPGRGSPHERRFLSLGHGQFFLASSRARASRTASCSLRSSSALGSSFFK